MKLILEQIDVDCRSDMPYMVCWRGGTYTVESVIDRWSTRGPWWTTDERREYILLSTSCGVIEIYRSSLHGWMMSRLFD